MELEQVVSEQVLECVEEIQALVKCDCCGQEVLADKVCKVYNNFDAEEVCLSCRCEEYFYCRDCGEYHSIHEDTIEYCGHLLCYNCSDNYRWCEECGRYVYYDDYDSESECCDSCRRDTGIEDYHENDDWCLVGESDPRWKKMWRGLGIELEIDRSERDSYVEEATVNAIKSIYSKLKFEYDGSLENGFEIITQPHTIKEFYKIDWAAILRACKVRGYTSHDAKTCGLHIHISREMFGRSEQRQANAIAKLIWFFENYWDDIVRVSRRTASQLSYAGKYGSTSIPETKNFAKSRSYQRYHAINNTNYHTVEIRIMRGTLNYQAFMASIDFCLRLVLNSRTIPWKDIHSVPKWLKGLRSETVDYIKSKKAFTEVI